MTLQLHGHCFGLEGINTVCIHKEDSCLEVYLCPLTAGDCLPSSLMCYTFSLPLTKYKQEKQFLWYVFVEGKVRNK